MREKTKDLISDLILEEVKECHDTRYEIRKIIREEIEHIEKELGISPEISRWAWLRDDIGDGLRSLSSAKVIEKLIESAKRLMSENIKLHDLLKQDWQLDINDYEYKTTPAETKLVKIKKKKEVKK